MGKRGSAEDPSDSIEDEAWHLYNKAGIRLLVPGAILAGVRRSLEDREKIRQLAGEILRIKPRRASVYVLLGHVALEEGDTVAARDSYLKAIEVSADPLEEGIWQGVILSALEYGPFELLAECLEKIYEKRPESIVAFRLADAYSSMGNPQKGITFLSIHLRKNPTDKKCARLKKSLESDL